MPGSHHRRIRSRQALITPGRTYPRETARDLRITDAALALDGKLEPELSLGDLEAWDAEGVLAERLAKATGRSAKAIAKALAAEPDEMWRARLRAACGNDDALLARVVPLHALLRADLRGDPMVLPAGSLYVTQALDRRAS